MEGWKEVGVWGNLASQNKHKAFRAICKKGETYESALYSRLIVAVFLAACCYQHYLVIGRQVNITIIILMKGEKKQGKAKQV